GAGPHADFRGARSCGVRRRRARRVRPAGADPGGALMAAFILRRLASMGPVLFAISVLTFVIFQAIPNGDPALRLAGRLATAQQIEDVRKQGGFDKPIYVQYVKTMEKVFNGEVISYTQQQNVESEIWRDL